VAPRRRLTRAVALVLAVLALAACGAQIVGDERGGGPSAPRVVFPTVSVGVELASTESERAKGLGGHAPLEDSQGMLFVFDGPGAYGFWMKDMTFALDILWIDGGKVVHVERDVPPPGPGDSDLTRPVYVPRAPARYVLEVNAGFTAAHGIDVGTPVELRGV
jgi:uncharacterized membrane protein (UPF0127 family)